MLQILGNHTCEAAQATLIGIELLQTDQWEEGAAQGLTPAELFYPLAASSLKNCDRS